jgi:hypothetical protein
VLLNRVTGGAQYLDDAASLADLTLATFGKDVYCGGPDGAYDGRAIYNAIFFLQPVDAVCRHSHGSLPAGDVGVRGCGV